MRRLGSFVLAVALAALQCSAARAADKTPYHINAILSETGPAAFIGASEARMLGILQTTVNRQGGINGRPVTFDISDDQSNPSNTLQFMSRLISDKVPIIYGPGFTATCAAGMALTMKDGPVTWCLAPGIYPAAGSYVFSSQATTDDTVLVLVRFMRERGWTRIAAISSTDASGQAFGRGLRYALAAPENKNVQLVVDEHMNPTDISIAAQVARVKSANPQAILTLATGSPWGTIMRGVAEGGLTAPIGGGNGNVIIDQLKQYQAFLPDNLYFPASIATARNSIGSGPIADAQAVFFKAFHDAGVQPDLGYSIGWDPAMLLVTALRKLGTNASSKDIRDYILNLHGWAGISGIYDFRDGAQRGVGQRSVVIDRWNKRTATFVPESRPAGYLK